MKILLVDVDSKIPNLALMKLSAYHKSIGDSVEISKLAFNGYSKKHNPKNVNAKNYDKVYVSCVFTNNKENFIIKNCFDILVGGTGINLETVLPNYIDSFEEDYSIYPENDISYGFITRGCIRDCPFCFVPDKEGKLHFYRDWKQIVKHDKVKFLDNNFLAYPDHKKILKELIDANIRFQFNQGLDIRLLDDENAYLLSKAKYFGDYIFAFDYVKMEKLIIEKLMLFKSHFSPKWRTKFFVYVHPSMDIINDVIYRIETLRNNYALPYVMRHESCWESENREFYIDLAGYCNQPILFKRMSFASYVNAKHPTDIPRIIKNIDLYYG